MCAGVCARRCGVLTSVRAHTQLGGPDPEHGAADLARQHDALVSLAPRRVQMFFPDWRLDLGAGLAGDAPDGPPLVRAPRSAGTVHASLGMGPHGRAGNEHIRRCTRLENYMHDLRVPVLNDLAVVSTRRSSRSSPSEFSADAAVETRHAIV